MVQSPLRVGRNTVSFAPFNQMHQLNTDEQSRLAAFATLPARLSRAASLDRKRSMQILKPPTTYEKYRQRAQYYVPVLNWLPKYSLKKLGNDGVAALTVRSPSPSFSFSPLADSVWVGSE